MKIDIYCDEMYPCYGISEGPADKKRYSLSDADYADYMRVNDEWEAWQEKLSQLKPDDYVPPPPLTEEEKARRLANYDRFELQRSSAYLDIVAPLPDTA